MAFTILDGNAYVSKQGIDDPSTTGTIGDPYLTIGYAIANGAGNKIVIGSGMYIESFSVGSHKLFGDGEVIIDQGALLSTGIILGASSEFTNITFRNFTSIALLFSGTGTFTRWNNCRFINNTTPYYHTRNSAQFYDCFWKDCVFSLTDNDLMTFYRCTVLNTAVAGEFYHRFGHCYVDPNSTIDGTNTIPAFDVVNEPNVIEGLIGGVDLATYQASNPTAMPLSVDVPALLNSKSPTDASLSENSPLRYLSNVGNYIGYAKEAQSLNNTDSAFDIAGSATVLSGAVVKVGTTYELDGVAEAVIETGVIETSGLDSRVLERIRVEGLEVPRFEVFDSTNDGTDLANQRTFEMKWADVTDIVAPSTTISSATYYKFIWNKKPQFDPINLAGNGDATFNPANAENIKTKFVQLKVTMRNNGVL